MTNNDYIQLFARLSELKKSAPRLSESQNSEASFKATTIVRASNLPQDEIAVLTNAISEQANPTGWYFQNNGISAALDILDEPYTFAEAA